MLQPPIGCQISLSDWGWCISGEVLMLLAAAKNSRVRPPDWPAAAVDVCCSTRVALKMEKIKRGEKIYSLPLQEEGPILTGFQLFWSKSIKRQAIVCAAAQAAETSPPTSYPPSLALLPCLSPRRGNAQSPIEAEVRGEIFERIWGERKKDVASPFLIWGVQIPSNRV